MKGNIRLVYSNDSTACSEPLAMRTRPSPSSANTSDHSEEMSRVLANLEVLAVIRPKQITYLDEFIAVILKRAQKNGHVRGRRWDDLYDRESSGA